MATFELGDGWQGGYRMQTTALDMDRDRIIYRMYGGYNIRPGWFYPTHDPAPGDSPQGRFGDSAIAPTLGDLSGLGFEFYGGSSPNAGGGQTYTPASNPLLTPEMSTTDVNGTQVTQATAPQATASAASQFAQALGGSVVTIPTPWSSTTQTYGIRLPDGTVVDATAVANILGNDAMWPSDATKSGEIAKLTGSQYQPGIATALASGTPVALTAGTVATPPPLQAVTPSAADVARAKAQAQDPTGISQSQASAATNRPNQSVPPQNQLVPASTGFPQTVDAIHNTMQSQAPDPTDLVGGIDNKWLLLGGAVLAVLFLNHGKG